MHTTAWWTTFVTAVLLNQLRETVGLLRAAKKITVVKGRNNFKLQCPLLERKKEKNWKENLGLVDSSDSIVWFVSGENEMVAASVEYNHKKYKFYPSTGELVILNVAYEDAGLYRCVVNYGEVGSGDGELPIEMSSSIKLSVSQPYENLWEEEYKGNFVRALISASITLCLFTFLCCLHKYRWREPKYTRQPLDEMEAGNGLRNLNVELEYCGRMGKIRKKHKKLQADENSFGGSETSGCDSSPLTRSPPPPPPHTLVANSGRATPAVVHVSHI